MKASALEAWAQGRGGAPGGAAITPWRAFGDVAAEHAALREGAGLWDRGAWGLLRFVGPARLTFLHKYCTQDVKGLQAGQGAYGCCLTVKGGLVADLWVLARADDALVVVAPGARDALVAHLSKYAVFDKVKIAPADDLTLLSVGGPRAAAVVEAVLGAVPAGDLAHAPRAWRDRAVDVVRDPQAGLDGVTLVVAPDAAPALADALVAAGARPVGSDALDAARVAGGWPLHGVDLDERTIPIEAGLEARGISFSKGCYIGQEVIARIAHRGHVNRALTGFDLEAAPAAALPLPLLRDGKEAGALTTVARTAEGALVGLGILHKKHAEPGTRLQAGPDGPAAVVASRPFTRG